MAKKKVNKDAPPPPPKGRMGVDPAFVARLLQFVEGGGPATGIWARFEEWMTSEEMGWSSSEIESQSEAIYDAAGMVR